VHSSHATTSYARPQIEAADQVPLPSAESTAYTPRSAADANSAEPAAAGDSPLAQGQPTAERQTRTLMDFFAEHTPAA